MPGKAWDKAEGDAPALCVNSQPKSRQDPDVSVDTREEKY